MAKLKISNYYNQFLLFAFVRMSNHCEFCLKANVQYVCSGCQQTLYCNKTCQNQHWTQIHFFQCGAKQMQFSKTKLSYDELFEQAARDLKEIPPLSKNVKKRFDQAKLINPKSVLASVLTDQLERFHDISYQKVVIDEFVTNVLSEIGMDKVKIDACNLMWKQAEQYSNAMFSDISNLHKHKQKLDNQMDKIQVLSSAMLKRDPVTDMMQSQTEDNQLDAYEMALDAYLDQQIDKYLEEHSHLKLVPRNPVIQKYLQHCVEQNTFIHVKHSFEPIGVKTRPNSEPDDENESDYEEEDDASQDERDDKDILPDDDDPYTTSAFQYPGGHVALQDLTDEQHEDGAYVGRTIVTDLQQLERLANGLSVDAMTWPQAVVYPLKFIQQGRWIKFMTSKISNSYVQLGIGSVLAIVGACTIINAGVYATDYFNGWVSAVTKKVYDGFTDLRANVEFQKEASTLMQKTLADLTSDFDALKNVTAGLKPTSISNMYWELVSRMDNATLIQKQQAANQLLSGFISHLENQSSSPEGPGTIVKVANNIKELLNFINTAKTTTQINAGVNETLGIFGHFFEDSLAKDMTPEQRMQVAGYVLNAEEHMGKLVSKIGNQIEILQNTTMLKQVGEESLLSTVKSTSETFEHSLIQVAVESQTAGEFARNWLIKKTNTNFLGRHLIDFVTDPVVQLSRTLDHYVKSRDFQELLPTLGLAGVLSSVANPSFLVIMGTYLMFNHARLKWLFYILAVYNQNMVYYHRNQHRQLLAVLKHNTTGDKETPAVLRKPMALNGDTKWFGNVMGELNHNHVMENYRHYQNVIWKSIYDHGIWLGMFAVLVGFMINQSEWFWCSMQKAVEISGGLVVSAALVVPYALPSVLWLAKKLPIKYGLTLMLGARRYAVGHASVQQRRLKNQNPGFMERMKEYAFDKVTRYYEWLFLFLVTTMGPYIQKYMWFGKCLKQ